MRDTRRRTACSCSSVDLKALTDQQRQKLPGWLLSNDLEVVAKLPHVNGSVTTTCGRFCQRVEEENARVAVKASSVWLQLTALSTPAARDLRHLVASDPDFANLLVTCVAAAIAASGDTTDMLPQYTCLDVAETTEELLVSLPPQPSHRPARAVCIGAIRFGGVEDQVGSYRHRCNRVANASGRLLTVLSRTWTTDPVFPFVFYVDNDCNLDQLLLKLFSGQYRRVVSQNILRASGDRLRQLGFNVDVEDIQFTRTGVEPPAFFVFTWHDDDTFRKAARHTIEVIKRSGLEIKSVTCWKVDNPSSQHRASATTLGLLR